MTLRGQLRQRCVLDHRPSSRQMVPRVFSPTKRCTKCFLKIPEPCSGKGNDVVEDNIFNEACHSLYRKFRQSPLMYEIESTSVSSNPARRPVMTASRSAS